MQVNKDHKDLRESPVSLDLLDQLDLVVRTAPLEEMDHPDLEVNEERLELLDNQDRGIYNTFQLFTNQLLLKSENGDSILNEHDE